MSNKRDITLGNKFKKQVVEVEVRNRRPRYVSTTQKEPSKEETESRKTALDNFELSSVSIDVPVEKKMDQNAKNRALFFGDRKLARSIDGISREKFPRPPHSGFNKPPHSGFSRPPQSGFNRPPHSDFSKPPQSAFPRPPHSGFNRPPQSGFNKPPHSGFSRPPQSGFNRPPHSGFNRPPQSGFNRPPHSGFSRPPQSGFNRPPHSGFSSSSQGGPGQNTKPPFFRTEGSFRSIGPSRPSTAPRTSSFARPGGFGPSRNTSFTRPSPFFKTTQRPSPFAKPFQPKPFQSFGAKKAFPFAQSDQKKSNYKKFEHKQEKPSRSRFSLDPANNVQLGHRFIGRIDSEEDISINLERQRSISAMKRAREKQKKTNRVIRDVHIFQDISVSSLSNLMAVSFGEVIQKLKELEILADKETKLDLDTANFIVQEFGHNVKVRVEPLNEIRIDQGLEEDREPRPPIVTVVGHVDHGKTSLLDALRMTQFTAKESGGITQSIGASQVFTKDNRSITFIDTPGHEIFTEMRARGVNVTDIVLVLVAADDGIKEQTIESIQHAKASKAFIIVVITKIDKPGANSEKIKQMLFQYNLAVESMGGDVPDIEVSSKTGQNLNELIDLILVCSENLNLVASSKPKASGIVLESHLDKAIGPVATIIIKSGTLKVQDSFLSGFTYGKVKAMRDWTGKLLKVATPSYPIQVMGFDETPLPGQDFIVMNELEARDLASKRKDASQMVNNKLPQEKNMTYTSQEIWNALTGKKKAHMMNFIIKADTSGSVEAIVSSITKMKLEDTECYIVLKGVGAVTESDVTLSKTSEAIIIAFKVDAPAQVLKTAQSFGIEIKKYSIIYKILEDIEDQVTDRLRPREEEISIGRAIVRQIFSKPKLPTIAGCFVTEGLVKRDVKCIVLRDGIHVYESKIGSLKHMRDDKREVKFNQECGIIVENFTDYKVGDIIECFEKRTIVG